jgi:hypothetical protein
LIGDTVEEGEFGNTLLITFPTDTFPLTRRAKLLMMIEAILSLLIIILLAARAVNIYS